VNIINISLFLQFVLIPNIAYAYVGPGMGGGVIASVLGVIIGLFTAIIGILWFPIKRYFKNRKDKN